MDFYTLTPTQGLDCGDTECSLENLLGGMGHREGWWKWVRETLYVSNGNDDDDVLGPPNQIIPSYNAMYIPIV